MPGNSPSVAFHEFVEPIRRTLSCITKDVVIVSAGGRRIPDKTSALTLASGEPIALNANGAGYTLSVAIAYAIIRNPDPAGKKFKVQTRAYEYAFRTFGGQKLVEYHWHPLGTDGFVEPHMHASGAKPHYPSPRISLESVVRAAIVEFGAETLRDDWDSVLVMNDTKFALYSSWRDATQLKQLMQASQDFLTR